MTHADYKQWPEDGRARWIRMGNFFGRVLMEKVKGYAEEQIDPKVSPEARKAAEQGIKDTIYGFMMLLDGVMDIDLDEEHDVEFVLEARVLQQGMGELLESFELAPRGEGLCMGFHGWIEGDYGEE